MMKKAVFFSLFALSLAACGGGGGGGNGSANTFASISALPTNGRTAISGKAITGQYVANLSTGTVSVGQATGPNNATAVAATTNGAVTGLSVSAPGSSASYDTQNGGSAVSNGSVVLATNAAGTDLFAVADSTSLGHNYQSYGAWVTGYNTGSGTVGVGSFGAATTAGGVPSGQTATYSGTSNGMSQDGGGKAYLTSSSVQVSTDFVNASIASTGTYKTDLNTAVTSSASELDFSGNGAVSGNGFAANIAGGTISGTANGTFFGPTAQEVGGTFSASGGGNTYIGAFGGN